MCYALQARKQKGSQIVNGVKDMIDAKIMDVFLPFPTSCDVGEVLLIGVSDAASYAVWADFGCFWKAAIASKAEVVTNVKGGFLVSNDADVHQAAAAHLLSSDAPLLGYGVSLTHPDPDAWASQRHTSTSYQAEKWMHAGSQTIYAYQVAMAAVKLACTSLTRAERDFFLVKQNLYLIKKVSKGSKQNPSSGQARLKSVNAASTGKPFQSLPKRGETSGADTAHHFSPTRSLATLFARFAQCGGATTLRKGAVAA